MAYTPIHPVAMTIDAIVRIGAGIAAVQTMLRVAESDAALGRFLPSDGGFLIGKAGAWNGTWLSPCMPPCILVEGQEPEYEIGPQNAWTVTHQINWHLIHKLEPSDTPVDADLRAWDEHNSIQMALKALTPGTLRLSLIGTAVGPKVFGDLAPPFLQRTRISTIAIRYSKGQP
jgi:hypothetical protein